MDEDLFGMSREQLLEAVKELRQAVRKHRDSTGHELCWHHPRLWGLLPESARAALVVPEWPEFLDGCIRYRRSLDSQLPTALRSAVGYEESGERVYEHDQSRGVYFQDPSGHVYELISRET